ncbi:fungal specific transcription factor [Colletotrichum camelliae]|nr:fungal specific transcription factor [Colletotrichum camelliae]
MMRQQRKGLSSSMWASEGKATSHGRPSTTPKAKAPTSSTVNPVVPRQPSPTTTAESCSMVNSIPTPPMSTSGFASTTAAATTKVATASYKSSDPAADATQAHRELKRYEQIVRRMQWKKSFLSEGYDKATVKFADEKGRAEAEMMFKLDFYEYYMLLERALVHLMGVFEIGVSPETTSTWGCSGKNGRSDFSTKHSFHENVILSLQKVENPLHEVLGTGDVLFQLSRAKTLRNWWKHAEDESKLGARKRRAAAAPLESFDLTLIFNAVFEGLDKGYAIADRWVEVLQSRMSWADEVMDTESDGEDAFDWMVDAMDWQAV